MFRHGKNIHDEYSIIDFLRISDHGYGKCPNGSRLDELWDRSNLYLEYSHSYIQWMFPTDRKSEHYPDSPVLTDEEIWIIRNDRTIKNNMLRSFKRMLRFYGFEITSSISCRIRKSSEFQKRKKYWLKKNDHNFLRITRILRSLKICGLEEYAAAFYEELLVLAKEYPDIAGPSVSYWEDALK